VTRPRTSVLTALLLLLALAAPAGAATPKEAKRFAERIVTTSDLPEAVDATRAVLARGGVGTKAGRRFVVRPRGKAATVSVTDLETLNLAVEARERETRSRLTLAQYARMLKDFGFPFRRGDAGPQMRKVLRVWVAQARRHPRDPQSFAPLFVAEMAKLQQPAIDIRRGRYDPGDLHLSLLETELMSAAFLRFEKRPRRAAVGAAQAGSKACSDFKKALEARNPFLGRGVSFASEYLAGQVLERALAELLREGTADERGDRAGKLSNAASIALKIQKLVAYYSSVKLAVIPQQPAVTAHESVAIGEQFGALAGYPPEDIEAYRKELDKIDRLSLREQGLARDCFAALGLPLLTNLDDLAGEVDSYRLSWTFQQERPGTARVNAGRTRALGYGFPRTKLQPVGTSEGRAILAIDILPGPGGRKSRRIGACADLDASQQPGIKTFAAAVQGGLGLADSIAELGAGWLQAVATPTTCNAMDVHYVDAHTFDLTLSGNQASNWDYRFESFPTICSDPSTYTNNGTQSLAFATPQPVRVTFRRVPGKGDYAVQVAGTAKGDIDMTGTVDRRDNETNTRSGPRACGGGEGTEPPPDCGPRPVNIRATLSKPGEALLLESPAVQPDVSNWGYRNCNAQGLYVRRLVEAAPALGDEELGDPDLKRIVVTGNASTSEDFTRTSPQGATTGSANHRIRWNARLDRVEQP
jgi:hypothetical protein